MKTNPIFLILLNILMISCNNGFGQNEKYEYYSHNDDQFTFVVFQTKEIDKFIAKFKPLSFENIELKNEIKKLQEVKFQVFDNTSNYHTRNVKESDFDLANSVIESALKEENQEYYSASIDYLFYYKCLPKEFQYKWAQTQLGNFEFNATFLSLLREKSNEYDQVIYGEIGFWDENLKFSFEDYIYNEITPEIAQKIKNTIETNSVFNDKRFSNDKESFLNFLNKTINKEYRLFLIDWD